MYVLPQYSNRATRSSRAALLTKAEILLLEATAIPLAKVFLPESYLLETFPLTSPVVDLFQNLSP